MPGIIVFKRRWSVGSDDMILPSFIFLIIHSAWLVILTYLFVSVDEHDWKYQCMTELYEHVLGYLIILSGCIITEFCICLVSSRGTIMDTLPRASMQYLLYVRLGILIVEIFWLGIGLIWLNRNYETCDHGRAKDVIFTFTICNCVLIFILIIIGWCAFDSAGRSWVKMKRYQNSLKESQCKYKYKRSGSTHRNWRHRKAIRKYQDSWNRRCQMLFCCLGNSDRNQSSFAEVAKILSEFFRDLDVVPSDVIAGLIIVRRNQKLQRKLVVNSFNNDISEYLSGVPITSKTKFLDVKQPEVYEELTTLIYYLDYAISVYGWPMFFMFNKSTACCKLCPYLKCCCFNRKMPLFNCFKHQTNLKKNSITSDQKVFLDRDTVSGDTCFGCNYAALNRLLKNKNYDLIYSSYHVEIGEPPFIVVLDHDKKTLIISVRGTLSLQDIITDLNAEGDLLPTNPTRENWLAHKGMIEAAVYIQTELVKNRIIERALNFDLEKNTQSYTITCVGHSLGAGVCTLLSILLKQYYPDLLCYAFAPPGGLMSYELVEYSKTFVTSVVLGKDIVPRLGLRQMESLRYDLIHAIKESQDPKYKIIGSTILCCYQKTSESDLLLNMDTTSIGEISNFNGSTNNGLDDTLPISTSCSTSYTTRSERELSCHPNDASIALSVHKPLYAGGKIIHIVSTHSDDNDSLKNKNSQPSKWRKIVKKRDVIYKALYVDNTDFNEILITPVMINDHMPNRIMDALQKLVANNPQQKIQRCKTISNGGYSNIGNKFRENHYGSDSASKPLLSYQYNSNWSNDTLDHASTIRTIVVQPTVQNQYEYPEMDLRPKKSVKNKVQLLKQRKQQNSRSINEIICKMKKIDLSTDEWIGKAPLATPETLSDTSSICSRSITTNDLNSSLMKRNSLKTVTEGILRTSNDSVSIQIENEPNDHLNKVDVSLGIDVNALFDKLEQATGNQFDRSNFETLTRKRIDDQLNLKFVKRTSSLKDHSLKRNDSTSSSKRVTFDTKAVINTGETVLINKSCRRANSERINRRKIFSVGTCSKNLKLKQIRQEHDLPIKSQAIKDRDQVDNELNEKLEELLGTQSFSYSDTDLSKLDDDDQMERLDDNSNDFKQTKTSQDYVHNDKVGKDKQSEIEYSPVKQMLSPIDDYPVKIATNMSLAAQQMTSKSNESSPIKGTLSFRETETENISSELYDKEQYEKLFQKLSTIESPIDESLSNCDNKFKSDLRRINE